MVDLPGNKEQRQFSLAKPISLKLLAEHLGLSRGTVSLVLNSSPGSEAIPERTRKRIFDAAREHNYKPNYFARALSLKRSFFIGILTTSLAEGYDLSLLAGIERHLIDTRYVYFVASHLWSKPLLIRSMQTLLERGAEGIILIHARPPEMRIGVPVITIGGAETIDGTSRISIDNRIGAALIVKHLYQLGHRKIAYLTGESDSLDTTERWDGIVQTTKALGLTINKKWIVPMKNGDRFDISGIEQGAAATEELLRRTRAFSALVCFNDVAAIGAINTFRAHGIRVPSEVSIVGFDDIQFAKATSPSLTTVRQPLLEMGCLAATQVVAQIESSKRLSKTTLMTPELIVRESSGPARAAVRS